MTARLDLAVLFRVKNKIVKIHDCTSKSTM